MEGYIFIEKANVTWFNVTLKTHKAAGWEKYVLWKPFRPAIAPVRKLPFNLTDCGCPLQQPYKEKVQVPVFADTWWDGHWPAIQKTVGYSVCLSRSHKPEMVTAMRHYSPIAAGPYFPLGTKSNIADIWTDLLCNTSFAYRVTKH